MYMTSKYKGTNRKTTHMNITSNSQRCELNSFSTEIMEMTISTASKLRS